MSVAALLAPALLAACGSLLSLDDPPPAPSPPVTADATVEASTIDAASAVPPSDGGDGGLADAREAGRPCETLTDDFEGTPWNYADHGWFGTFASGGTFASSPLHSGGVAGLSFQSPASAGGAAFLQAELSACPTLERRVVTLQLRPNIVPAGVTTLLRLRRSTVDTEKFLALRMVGPELEISEEGSASGRLAGLANATFQTIRITIDAVMSVAVLELGSVSVEIDITGGLPLRGVDLGVVVPPAGQEVSFVIDDFTIR